MPVRISVKTLGLFVFLCSPPYAMADNLGDISQGLRIAKKDCSECHQINGEKTGKASQAPAFSDIAKMESATALSIRVFLKSSHRKKSMPSIILSEDEIDAMVSYIFSLRKK